MHYCNLQDVLQHLQLHSLLVLQGLPVKDVILENVAHCCCIQGFLVVLEHHALPDDLAVLGSLCLLDHQCLQVLQAVPCFLWDP